MQLYKYELSSYLAQAYGEGDYGGGAYSENTTTTETPSSLVDTGTGLVLAGTVAATIIFVVLVVRILRRTGRKDDQ